jgi:hypothetical protein
MKGSPISMTLPAPILRRKLCATACAMMLLMPAACAPASRGDFCTLYLPVYTAAEDSAETRRQADANNAVWLEICEKPGR